MATGMIQPKSEGAGTYTYSSQPRAVQQGKKYREQSAYGNIMYDRRIVRGNTYALHTLPASSQPDPLELQRQQESRRRALARKRAREQFKPRSPEPVEGRKHIEVQIELYLEEITDRVEEADVQTQTDAFLDRPSTPLFVPAKTGMDAATQIEEGDLFDFDLEVRPILEVLVGKTVEQALLEVMEEEELASLRAQQRTFEENRNAEVVETQRLEEQERRRREEKDRRMQQQREALLKEKETAEKIAARAFAQSYLADLVPSVFSTLNQNGFFYDPVEREIETVFMPILMEETEKSLDKRLLARTLLDAIIRAVVADKLGIELAAPEPTMETAPPPPSQGEPTSLPDSQQQEVSKVFGEQKLEAEAGEVKEDKASSDETKVAEGDETKVAEGETKVIEGDETKVAKGETKVIEGDKTKVVEGETKVAEGDETKVAGEEVPPASEDAGTVDTEVESIKANADGTPPAVKEPETESLQTDKHQEADKAEVSPDEPNKTDEEPSDSIKDSRETDTVDTKTEETDAESADQPNTSSEQS